MVINKYDDEIA